VLDKFVADGLLTAASLASKLEGEFKATDIKEFLRQRALPQSGRKADCIARLVAADPTGMESKVAGIAAYVCTPKGKEIAEQFLSAEAERSRVAREKSLRLLQGGDVHGSLVVVAEFERQQVFQRGVGVDWNNRPSREDADLVHSILSARPSILKGMPENGWRIFQTAAAMMEMWGERSAKQWLPEDIAGPTNLDKETAARMILFAGQTKTTLGKLLQSEYKRVEVLGSDDTSCPPCRKIARRKYRISDAPEIPCPDCTNEAGCRCMLMPVFE